MAAPQGLSCYSCPSQFRFNFPGTNNPETCQATTSTYPNCNYECAPRSGGTFNFVCSYNSDVGSHCFCSLQRWHALTVHHPLIMQGNPASNPEECPLAQNYFCVRERGCTATCDPSGPDATDTVCGYTCGPNQVYCENEVRDVHARETLRVTILVKDMNFLLSR